MTVCRFSRELLGAPVLDLGMHPPSNSYLEPTSEAKKHEKRFPLQLGISEKSGLVQLMHDVPAGMIFNEKYAYFSSFSTSWLEHAKLYSDQMITKLGLNEHSFVVEVASNDGYLLQNFVKAGIPCLGVEPSKNCVEAAAQVGVQSVVAFFDKVSAKEIMRDYGKANLIAANNVLAHVPEINPFVEGFSILLDDHGVATFEFPHLAKLVEEGQFDTIYHEHYSYLSLIAVKRIMGEHGLRVFDVEQLSTHGGSLRVHVCKENARYLTTPFVQEIIDLESKMQLDRRQGLEVLVQKADDIKSNLLKFLRQAKADKKNIAAYGAAAKGNTLLNFCGVSAEDIAFVVDKNIHKQGRLLPGSHIPIVDAHELQTAKPDYVIILPWNLADEIRAEHAYISQWGGRFVRAQPELTIL